MQNLQHFIFIWRRRYWQIFCISVPSSQVQKNILKKVAHIKSCVKNKKLCRVSHIKFYTTFYELNNFSALNFCCWHSTCNSNNFLRVTLYGDKIFNPFDNKIILTLTTQYTENMRRFDQAFILNLKWKLFFSSLFVCFICFFVDMNLIF